MQKSNHRQADCKTRQDFYCLRMQGSNRIRFTPTHSRWWGRWRRRRLTMLKLKKTKGRTIKSNSTACTTIMTHPKTKLTINWTSDLVSRTKVSHGLLGHLHFFDASWAISIRILTKCGRIYSFKSSKLKSANTT